MGETMDHARLVTRRTFLADLGRGAFALAVVGVAGCAPGATTTSGPSGVSPTARPGGSASPPVPSAEPPASAGTTPPGGGVAWERVDLGFVSAYVLVRGGEAAVVDTGVAGSEGDIEAALGRVGLGWGDVGHVIITHLHSDHAGSAAAVLERAAGAAGYAGAADIPSIPVPRALVAVADNDSVFALQIIATPGHTAGHVCVLDPVAGILVAGDALGTSGGGVVGPNAQFTADMPTALESVDRLAALRFETLLVGHGDPIEADAATLVAELAAQG
jgi:glyoxylase-like metal-dependent hydrolase (beta-lactamase superfamily II)